MTDDPLTPKTIPDGLILATFRQVLIAEATAISQSADRMGAEIERAVEKLLRLKGRTIFTGMGKAGYIARKGAATFCSTGAPAIYLHPSEALHGDLGIVTGDDLLIAISNSGETAEVLELLPFMARLQVPVIAITGNANSPLALRSEIVIDASVESEADPISVAPTSSTTLALAICDGLAVALMKERGITREQFAIFHPGGSLGRKLLIKVQDLMRIGDSLPLVSAEATLMTAVSEITAGKMGTAFIVQQDRLTGILTDGDLRRIYQQAAASARSETNSLREIGDQPVGPWMTREPKRVTAQALAAEALKLMEDHQISVLPVVDPEGDRVVGAIHLHDLIRAGLA